MKKTSKKRSGGRSLARMRRDYSAGPGLEEKEAAAGPIEQFGKWFDDAVASGEPMANAMVLSTVTAEGRPEARSVLLKDYSPEGFVFFTSYESPKGRELAAIPYTSLLFYWPILQRQIRITGKVRKVPAALSDEYFQSRPREYQVGALASRQSEVIPYREVLIERYAELTKKYEGRKIPRPSRWGGYLVVPDAVEFWQGRPNRLHDRLKYTRAKRGPGWLLERLAP